MLRFWVASATSMAIRSLADAVINERSKTIAGTGSVLVLLQSSRHGPLPVLPSELTTGAAKGCFVTKPRLSGQTQCSRWDRQSH